MTKANCLGEFAGHVMKEFMQIHVEKGSVFKKLFFLSQDHLKECDFVDVSCPKNCGKEFQRKDLKEHLEDDCPNRTIPCTFCAEEVLWNSMEVCCRTQFTVLWVEKVFS